MVQKRKPKRNNQCESDRFDVTLPIVRTKNGEPGAVIKGKGKAGISELDIDSMDEASTDSSTHDLSSGGTVPRFRRRNPETPDTCSSEKDKTVDRAQNLAHDLARIGDHYIGIDTTDTSNGAMFVKYLLDRIEFLNAVNASLRTQLRAPPTGSLFKSTAIPSVSGYQPGNTGVEKDETQFKGKDEAQIKDKDEPEIEQKDEVQFKRLYRIHCAESNHLHEGSVSEEEPEKPKSDYLGLPLTTKKTAMSLSTYLESHPNLPFIVLKEHICSKRNEGQIVGYACPCQRCVQIDSTSFPRRTSNRCERLQIFSSHLKEAITHVATCRPDGITTATDNIEMDAPYLFLYHHRSAMATLMRTSDGDKRKHIELLLSFLEESYGVEYREADELIRAGKINKKHVDKLFRPSQTIVVQGKDEPSIFVVQSWPAMCYDMLRMLCWDWKFDGKKFRRNPELLGPSCDADEVVSINQLDCYPTEYAPTDLNTRVLERGRKMWRIGPLFFASYTGWDAHHDQIYVCIPTSF